MCISARPLRQSPDIVVLMYAFSLLNADTHISISHDVTGKIANNFNIVEMFVKSDREHSRSRKLSLSGIFLPYSCLLFHTSSHCNSSVLTAVELVRSSL